MLSGCPFLSSIRRNILAIVQEHHHFEHPACLTYTVGYHQLPIQDRAAWKEARWLTKIANQRIRLHTRLPTAGRKASASLALRNACVLVRTHAHMRCPSAMHFCVGIRARARLLRTRTRRSPVGRRRNRPDLDFRFKRKQNERRRAPFVLFPVSSIV